MPTRDSTQRSAPNAPRARASSAYPSLRRERGGGVTGEELNAGSSEREPGHPAADHLAGGGRLAGGARLGDPAELRQREDVVEQQDRAPGRDRSRSKPSWRSKRPRG